MRVAPHRGAWARTLLGLAVLAVVAAPGSGRATYGALGSERRLEEVPAGGPLAVTVVGVARDGQAVVEPSASPEAAALAAGGEVRPLPAGKLDEAAMREVLAVAGWPEDLHEQALAVAWCESRWGPTSRGDHGASVGLFQLNLATWFRWAGEDPDMWADPVVNARVALATYRYDIDRGSPPWTQWTCKP